LPGGKGEGQAAKESKPCFNYQIGLCPGTCIGAADPAEYRKTIANLKLFFAGKKKRVIAALEREMKAASAALEFEKAEKSRRRLFALQHIQDVALIADDKFQIPNAKFRRPFRIEGYDISNIGGDHAVGSMAVFEGERPAKDEYRRFAIRTVIGSNDTAMFQEVLTRRFDHAEWKFPDLILVDGGVPQVNAVRRVLRERRLRIPVMGLAKGPERKRNDLIGIVPPGFSKETLIRLRDEAHRFAVAYHRRMRARRFTRPLS
jgi:excinuclease ABC subunit C